MLFFLTALKIYSRWCHRCWIFLLLFFAPTFNSFSQQYLVDSLENELSEETNPYKIVDLHLGLSRAYLFVGELDKAHHLADTSLVLAQKAKWKKGEILAFIFQEMIGVEAGKGLGSIQENFTQAYNMAMDLGDKDVATFAAYLLAEHFLFDLSDFNRALEILNQSIKNADETVSPKHLANTYKVMGLTYEHLMDLEKSTSSYIKALEYIRKVKENPTIIKELGGPSCLDADKGLMNTAQILSYLGLIESKKGNYEKGLAYLDEARQINIQGKSELNIAHNYIYHSDIYEKMGRFADAVEATQNAIRIYEKLGYTAFIADDYIKVGEFYLDIGVSQQAIENFNLAAKYALEMEDSISLMESYIGKSEAFNQLGDWDRSLMLLDQANRFAQTLENNPYAQKINFIFGSNWLEKGEFKKAIHYFSNSFKALKQVEFSENFFYVQLKLAQSYHQMGIEDSTKYFINTVFEGNTDWVSSRALMDGHRVASKIYEDFNETSAALYHHKKFFELYEEMYTNKAQEILREEQVRQNVAKAQQEKKQAELQASLLNSRNNLFFGLLVAAGIILLLITYFFFRLRQNKREMEEKNQLLEQLNATKDKFFGIIAHDIRSPIIALSGVGEQLEYYLGKQKFDKLQQLGNRVEKTTQRLNALLDNLLNWALLQQGVIPYHPQPIDLQKIAATTAEMFAFQANHKNIELKIDLPENLEVLADERALSTILRNLISNALKFTRVNGTVSISSEQHHDRIFIQISDSGTGISAEKMKKLFSIGKKTDSGTRGERGTGLGLILVKELAEMNQGAITVESEIDKGSKFTVDLPLAV